MARQTPDSPARARAPRLTRERIAQAVLTVGFERLTIVAVAEQLGVVHAALYRHVSNRDELVVVGVEQALSELSWAAPSADWREFLTSEAAQLWRLVEDHPGLAEEIAILEGRPTGVKQRQWDATDHLERLGFEHDDALLAADAVFDLVFDVSIRTAVINTMNPAASGQPWFEKKLELMLAGIETLLAPPDQNPR